MNRKLIDFFNANEDEINNGEWLIVYLNCDQSLRGELTKILNEADIHPELELKELPAYFCYGRKDLTSYVVGEQCTRLYKCAFYYAENLKKIILPDTLTQIGSYCFANCKLESLVLPSSLRKIGSNAFAWNTTLTELVLDTNIVEIGSNAFYASDNINIVYKGTMSQFDNIKKLEDWDELNNFRKTKVKVSCIDGVY